MRGGGWSLCAQGFRASGLARCRERASAPCGREARPPQPVASPLRALHNIVIELHAASRAGSRRPEIRPPRRPQPCAPGEDGRAALSQMKPRAAARHVGGHGESVPRHPDDHRERQAHAARGAAPPRSAGPAPRALMAVRRRRGFRTFTESAHTVLHEHDRHNREPPEAPRLVPRH